MMWTLFCLLGLVAVRAEVRESIQEGIRLSSYVSYRSVSLVGFQVKEQAVRSTWLFKAYSKPMGCPVRNVTVYLQQGGYPIISPKDETFPDGFYTGRDYLYNQTFQTQGQIMAFTMLNPKPGTWYAAAFLTDRDDGIKQKGLGMSCSYFATVSHVSPTLDDIPEVAMSPDGSTLHHVTLNKTDNNYLLRYPLPKGVYRYDVTVLRCIVGTVDMTDIGCSIRLLTSGSKLPTEKGSTTNCSEFTKQPCHHVEPSPVPLEWNYLGIYIGKTENYELTLNFTLSVCTSIVLQFEVPIQRLRLRAVSSLDGSSDTTITTLDDSEDAGTIYAFNKSAASVESSPTEETENNCLINPMMDQSRISTDYFKFTYLMSAPNREALWTNLTGTTTIFPFELGATTVDGGGTLSIMAKIVKEQSENVSVTWCLSRSTLPLNGTELLCKEGLELNVNTSRGVGTDEIHIPYPESGMWYLAGKRRCYAHDPRTNRPMFVSCINNHSTVGLHVRSTPCVSDTCGNNGECRTFYSGVYFFTNCYCYSGYRGYLCSDGQEAMSETQELINFLLLTLSNIFFFPAAVISMHRRYWVQGVVYLFTMCFSSFYHACDRSTKYRYCLVSYDVLSYCDFYGSILSACVTIIAMSKVNEPIRSVALISSCLFLAFGVSYDKHSLWVFGVPVLVSLVVMFVAWGCFCRSRHSCYPPKLRYLTHLLPGASLALLGVLLFGLIETNANYPYVHSAWHALMACAVMCGLPPRSKRNLDSQESLLIGLNSQKDLGRSNEVRLFAADQTSGDCDII